ncbi:hypothetical protein PHMEG_00021245 [Phytophthora megakarya]|uniref:Uncharacterized protein n=1 Tax=Phytophthora megakarya TaxID=4795 RepID=A0A225VMD2_9STRA|nr:hypothetical protein PHMEG_00021245 [Phytophthora megakarya]
MTGASEFQEQLSAYCLSEQPPYSVFLMVSRNNAPPPPFQPAQVESDSEGSDPASDAEPGTEGGTGGGSESSGVDPADPNPASAPSTPPKKPSTGHSDQAKKAMVPGEGSLPASDSKEPKSTPPPSSQGNSLLRPVPGVSETNLLGHLFDADYDMRGGDTEAERNPLEEKQEEDHSMGEEPGAKDLAGSEDVELEGVSGSGPRMSADRLRQVRPTVYDPQTDTKGGFYRPIDSDADPVRPVEELAKVLTRSKVEDVRMDVLEYWQMDTDRCTLTEAEDAIQGRTTEGIIVHVSLRKDILVEFLRRALILSFLDEVPWFQHVPEEFFDRALAEAEDDDWELGIGEGVNPWPSVPLQPRDSPSPSEHEEDASGDEQDGHGPDDETSLAKSWVIYNTRVRRTSTRLKHQNRGFPDYESVFGHSRKPCVWIPMDPRANKTLRVQLDLLDQREPARLYWGSSCPEERIAESVSSAVWVTRVTVHTNRLPVPEPEEYVMPRRRR